MFIGKRPVGIKGQISSQIHYSSSCFHTVVLTLLNWPTLTIELHAGISTLTTLFLTSWQNKTQVCTWVLTPNCQATRKLLQSIPEASTSIRHQLRHFCVISVSTMKSTVRPTTEGVWPKHHKDFIFKACLFIHDFKMTLKDITKDTVAISHYGLQHVEMCQNVGPTTTNSKMIHLDLYLMYIIRSIAVVWETC